MIPSNSRYPHFKQIQYTAGDEEQFEMRREYYVFDNKKTKVEPRDYSSLYLNPTSATVTNTFHYLFYKIKKGTLVQIRKGNVNFIPFSNAHYINEWSHLIKDNMQYPLEKKRWVANHYLVRNEKPLNEKGLGLQEMKHMLEQVCKHYPVPDMEFFVNVRDFPLLRNDLHEPYTPIWGNCPLKSHVYESYSPILSMVEHPDHADVAIPTPEEWARANPSIKYHKTNAMMARQKSTFCLDWNKKIKKAVFRGTNTGPHINMENLRIKLCCKKHRLLDAGLTKINSRFYFKDGVLVRTHKSFCSVKTSLTDYEQSCYKYIINVPGHVQAFRLSRLLFSKSLIIMLKDDRNYAMWFEKYMIEGVHYISCTIDELEKKLEWCSENDAACKTIAENAYAFANQYLHREGMLKYVFETLTSIQSFMCNEMYQYNRKEVIYRYPNMDHMKLICNQMLTFTNDRCFIKSCSTNNVTAAILSEREQHVGFALNHCLQWIPNFPFTFTNSIEFISNVKLSQQLKTETDIENQLAMIASVLLGLEFAQEEYGYSHNNLTCDTIYVKNSRECFFDYNVNNCVWRVVTKCVPVITNTSKARTNCSSSRDLIMFWMHCIRLIDHPYLEQITKELIQEDNVWLEEWSFDQFLYEFNPAYASLYSLENRKPSDLVAILSRYTSKVSKVNCIEHINYGKVAKIYRVPTLEHDVFHLMLLQQLWLRAGQLEHVHNFLFQHFVSIQRPINLQHLIVSNCAQLNVLKRSLFIGGPFAYTEEEKQLIREKILA